MLRAPSEVMSANRLMVPSKTMKATARRRGSPASVEIAVSALISPPLGLVVPALAYCPPIRPRVTLPLQGDGVPHNRPQGLITPAAYPCVAGSGATRRTAGFILPARQLVSARPLPTNKRAWDGQCLVRLGAVDRAGAGRGVVAGLGRGFGGAARDHHRCGRRQPRHHAADTMGQLPRRLWGDPADLSRRC